MVRPAAAHHTPSIPHTHQEEEAKIALEAPHDPGSDQFPAFPALDELRAKKTVLRSVLSLLGAEAQDTAPAVRALMRQVPYAAAPLVGDLLLEPMDSIGADRVAARLRAVLPPETQQEDVAAQAAQIASQLQLAHALVQDGQTELAALGAWRSASFNEARAG